jgi:hypothetical protein
MINIIFNIFKICVLIILFFCTSIMIWGNIHNKWKDREGINAMIGYGVTFIIFIIIFFIV